MSNPSPNVFKGTATYYAKYRPGIPKSVLTHIKQRFNLDGEGVLLDMGCGAGQSTLAFAPLFQKTIAFDPDPEMLLEAEKKAPHELDISWQQRSDKDITPTEGPYRLVIACRSFNWMDQYPLLKKLHGVIESGGGIALIGDGSFWTGQDPWQIRVKEIIQDFLGTERRAGEKTYSSTNEPYITMLDKSNYKNLHVETIPIIREWTITEIIGYLYSTSFAAKHLFGDQIDSFEHALEIGLSLTNNGEKRFIEHTEFTIQSGFV